MDAIVFDVNRFRALTIQYGRRFGSQVLRNIGSSLKKLARETGGIACREGTDTFLLYCPHRDDLEQLFKEFLFDVLDEKSDADKITLRFGVFTDAQREPDIDERFDRARIAADRVKDDSRSTIGFYDAN